MINILNKIIILVNSLLFLTFPMIVSEGNVIP